MSEKYQVGVRFLKNRTTFCHHQIDFCRKKYIWRHNQYIKSHHNKNFDFREIFLLSKEVISHFFSSASKSFRQIFFCSIVIHLWVLRSILPHLFPSAFSVFLCMWDDSIFSVLFDLQYISEEFHVNFRTMSCIFFTKRPYVLIHRLYIFFLKGKLYACWNLNIHIVKK